MLVKPIREYSEEHFDFVIVGGGSAGAVVASRLAERNYNNNNNNKSNASKPLLRILLIEAGGRVDDSDLDARVPLACGKTQKTKLDWSYTTQRSEGGTTFRALVDRVQAYPRGKCLGGSSVLNYMAYVRGSKHDYDAWNTRHGADGWSWNDVLPLFRKSEDNASITQKILPSKDSNTRIVQTTTSGAIDAGSHGVGGPLGVSVAEHGSKLPDRFVRAAEELGFVHADYNNGEMENVASRFQHTIRKGARSDTASAFLFGKEAPPKANLFVATHGQVTKLLFHEQDKTRVIGVQVADVSHHNKINKGGNMDEKTKCQEQFHVYADTEVIVSCGAFGSPHLLLLSGIGPRQHLESVGIECIVDSPDVGQHLEDHPFVGLVCEAKQTTSDSDIGAVNGYRAEGFPHALRHLFEWAVWGTGTLATPAYDATLFFKTDQYRRLISQKVAPTDGPDAQIAILCSVGDAQLFETNWAVIPDYNFVKHLYDQKDPQGFILIPTLLHPLSKGNVTLRSSNPFVYPNIDLGMLVDESDKERMVEILRKCQQLLKTDAFASVVGKVLYPPELVHKHDGKVESDAFLTEYAIQYGMGLYHPTSTCKIGKVVDARLKVKGVEGLRVADASVMPTIVTGNTNAACIMIGEKAAEVILQDHEL